MQGCVPSELRLHFKHSSFSSQHTSTSSSRSLTAYRNSISILWDWEVPLCTILSETTVCGYYHGNCGERSKLLSKCQDAEKSNTFSLWLQPLNNSSFVLTVFYPREKGKGFTRNVLLGVFHWVQ